VSDGCGGMNRSVVKKWEKSVNNTDIGYKWCDAWGLAGIKCLPELPWAFPRGKAAGSVLRRARPVGLGSARPAFRPAKMLCTVQPRWPGAHCGRALLRGSLPFTPHTLSPLTQEKTAASPPALCMPGAAQPPHLGGVPFASGVQKIQPL
jgi:hypothetical protein